MNEIIPNVLFTSYLCNKDEPIISEILQSWQEKNPDFEIKYFSDNDIDIFFDNHTKKETYKKLKMELLKQIFLEFVT